MIEAGNNDTDLWPTLDSFDFGEAGVVQKPRPVWPEAASTMNIDVAVNADSSIWVIHDKPFPDYVEWVEFDTETRIMTFVTAGGKIQDLGMIIHPPMDGYVARAKKVMTVWVENGKILDMGLVALTVRKTGTKKRGKIMINSAGVDDRDAIRYPQGREISRFALEAMGLTPGDIGEVINTYRYDTGLKAGGLEKLTRTMEHDGIESKDAKFLKDQTEKERLQEQQRREAEQRQQQERQQLAQQEQKTEEQKQFEDKQLAEKRALEEKANQGIFKTTLGFALFPLGLGLSVGAMGATANIMSSGVAGVGDTTMVASTNNGGMLESLRGLLGIANPAQQDRLVTGPGETAAFIPGQAPVMNLQPIPQMQNVPGMAGPAPNVRA